MKFVIAALALVISSQAVAGSFSNAASEIDSAVVTASGAPLDITTEAGYLCNTIISTLPLSASLLSKQDAKQFDAQTIEMISLARTYTLQFKQACQGVLPADVYQMTVTHLLNADKSITAAVAKHTGNKS